MGTYLLYNQQMKFLSESLLLLKKSIKLWKLFQIISLCCGLCEDHINSSSDFFLFFVNWISLSFSLCKATLSYLCAASMVSADIFGISKLLRAHLKSRLLKWCLNDLKLLLETALEPARAQPACRQISGPPWPVFKPWDILL